MSGVVGSAIGGAVGGAFMGAAIGYFTRRQEKDRHIGRYLLMGAAVGAAFASTESLTGISLSASDRLAAPGVKRARAALNAWIPPQPTPQQVPPPSVQTSGFAPNYYPYSYW